MQSVRERSGGHPTHFGIQLSLNLAEGRGAEYGFHVRAEKNGGFSVQSEKCRVHPKPLVDASPHHFRVEKGKLLASSPSLHSSVEPDRLFLTAVSAVPEFREIFQGLTRMGFYNLNPDRIRALQDPDPGRRLARDGRNVASVLRELRRVDPEARESVVEYLRQIVPGLESVDPKTLGPKETIEFRQTVDRKEPWRFLAGEMSDGTLRALGVLVAVFQRSNGESSLPLVGIEEPELAIHPGAAEILAEALVDASRSTQVLLTTHSPDFLDHEGFSTAALLSVERKRGGTIVAPVDEASRSALRDRLYSAGELLRMGQLEPDAKAAASLARERDLFDEPLGP